MLIGSKAASSGPTIEMTPIIDMVFLLLIFFLVTTTYHQIEREIKIGLPEAESGSPISVALRELIINVTSAGTVIVSGQEITVDQLRTIITDALEQNPKQKVTIRGDKDASYGQVATVLDACKSAGVDEPFLDTVPAN